ncbi:protein induced by osmotic stress [Scheffersomyces amazonensis]|uniref:protein induced by osmotic stress n=1 Tax=Scheffersomyces amazonensis TaxID=1078765 RepID=UPI00315CF4D8
MTASTVFISGATGFIAQHIILQLLKKGYNVVGQVRSSSKGDALAKDVKSSRFSYEVVEVLEKEGAFDNALASHPEVSVFIHTASPVTFSPEDNERDVLIPAINGTKNVLASIKKVAPQIKRVILTSSAVASGSFAELQDPKFIGGEDSWNPITYEQAVSGDAVAAYEGSKKFAEQAAWDFVKKEHPKFSLTAILPVYVFGPQAFVSGLKSLNETTQLIANVLQLKKDDPIPPVENSYVDVRDAAAAHIGAFEKDSAAGKRLLVTSGRFHYQNVVDIVRENFPQYADQLPIGTPAGKNQFAGYTKLEDSNATQILGIDYIGFKKVISDEIKQILDNQA